VSSPLASAHLQARAERMKRGNYSLLYYLNEVENHKNIASNRMILVQDFEKKKMIEINSRISAIEPMKQ
jgi:hypothetical protein